MKTIFRYISTLIRELVSNNIVKLSLIVSASILFHYAGTFTDTKNQINIIKTYVNPQDSLENLYLSSSIKDNKIKYNINQLSDFDNPVVKQNVITYYTTNDMNIILWVIFGIILTFIVVGSLMDDDNVDWGISYALKEAFYSTIYCEIEGSEYIYMSFGRLITKSGKQIKDDRYAFGVDSFAELWRCPKYQTIDSKRDTLLDKILK